MTDDEIAQKALTLKIRQRYVDAGKSVPSDAVITKALAAALWSPEHAAMHGNRQQRRQATRRTK